MERTLITSNFAMTSDLYPSSAGTAARSSRRVHYISPAASAAGQNASSRKKKNAASPPPPSAAATATVLTSPPATDNAQQYTRPKQREQDEQVVAKTGNNTSRIATARTSQAKAQGRPRRRPAAAAASLPMAFCNALEEAINTFVDPPALRPAVDPRNVLTTNFAPVDELPPTPCPVVRGAIPRCLAGGAYIRNGPNPQHLPRGPHHLFDGDGMLHSLLLPRRRPRPQTPCCARDEPGRGVGLANTSLAFFGGRLFALGESDLPYAVRVDAATGEVFAFRYGPVPPFVTYFRFDAAGNKGPDVPIFSVRQPSFMHDFAVTDRYAIFPELQIVMKPMDMVVGGGSPVGSDSGKVPRLGVLPRYATDESEMRWFEVPGFNMMHSLNAWEEAGGEELVLVAPNVLSVEHALEHMELVHSCVEKIAGVAKLDFDRAGTGDCTVARRDFGPGCFAGEPFFVPDDVEGNGNEDDGYLVCYVHNERTDENRFVVMDARSPQLDIVAEVQLPARVPYGFHGLFVTQAELQSQHQ
ncbi:hypothetical protein EJB05_19671, partial [Eragrostis curvula]